MFEVLVYLFENYYQSENYPDQDVLARKLTAAGFENGEITEALDWLNGLVGPGEGTSYEHIDAAGTFRAFTQSELEKLKVVILMVLWTRRGDVDSLMLEELLPSGGPQYIH